MVASGPDVRGDRRLASGWLAHRDALGGARAAQLGGKAFGIGVGLTAYTLGLRHAFDADHIAAIDNTTRKLMSDGHRPLAVGFFFHWATPRWSSGWR